MLYKFKVFTLAVLTLSLAGGLFSADESKPAVPDNAYARKLDERVAKIVASLELTDTAKATRVHALIVAQYRALNAWHEQHDARLKELKKTESAAEIEAIRGTLKIIHENYLALLASELSPELIERVKDGMTVGKVQFTYTGYVQQNPALTDAQKAKVLELLKQAREEAMDAGSMDEKSDIFNRYKGRINNWLSKQGVDQGKGKKPKAEKSEPAAK